MTDYPEHRCDRQERNARIAIAAVEAAKEPEPMPKYDEAALNLFIEKGRIAWADVPDANKWLEELRGNG